MTIPSCLCSVKPLATTIPSCLCSGEHLAATIHSCLCSGKPLATTINSFLYSGEHLAATIPSCLCSGEHLAATIHSCLCSGEPLAATILSCLYSGELLAGNLGTRSHTRNGRGGACVPARTSVQRRFHPQRARSPPAKEPFPFINDACSRQNMFVYLPMDAPSWGDTGGHIGAAPTNLHQIPLPAIISCVCPSAEPLPAIL